MRERIAIAIGFTAAAITGALLCIPQTTDIRLKRHWIEKNGDVRTDPSGVEVGWPLTYHTPYNQYNDNVDYLAMYGDVILSVLLAIGAGVGVGQFVYRAHRLLQFSLRSMFFWTLVVAMILSVGPFYLAHRKYDPLYVTVTAVASLVLSAFAAAWGIPATARWLLKLRNR